MAEVFISHAAADKPLVSAFEKLLRLGVGLQHNQVFCTSLEGQGIPAGKDFKAYIREQLAGASVVVAIITPSYYNSAFCVCELGATWMLATQEFLPLLVPPVDFKDLRGVLAGIHCLRIRDEAGLDDIRDRLSSLVGEPVRTARWTVERDGFLAGLPEILSKLAKPPLVKKDELDAVVRQRDDFKAEVSQMSNEIEDLKQRLAEVSSLKDRAAVVQINRKHTKEWDQFTELLTESKNRLDDLPRAARLGLYYAIRDEPFYPAQEQCGDVDEAREKDFLFQQREGGVSINRQKPRIRSALESIEELQSFASRASSDFQEQYEEKYDDNLNVESRDFWTRHFRVFW